MNQFEYIERRQGSSKFTQSLLPRVYLAIANKKKNTPRSAHNNPGPPATTMHSPLREFESVNGGDISVRRNPGSGVYRLGCPICIASESSQSHFPHQPPGRAILPPICRLPVSTLARNLFLLDSARRRCPRYINFANRSSLKNKFSSLSMGEQVKEWLARAVPSDSLRIQIISPSCFCVHLYWDMYLLLGLDSFVI